MDLAALARYVGENVASTATNELRSDLTAHCLRLALAFHKQHTAGELVERIDGDVNALSNCFSQFAIDVLANAVLMAGVVAVFFAEDWRVGLGMTLFAAVALYVLVTLRQWATAFWREERARSAELYGLLAETLAATEDIRASGAEGYALGRYHRIVRPWAWARQKAGASIIRVRELLDTRPRIQDGPGTPLLGGPLAVRFDRVSFHYEDDEELVLSGIDFDLAPGQVLGLLGRTGSGNSALARLLLRFYDPTVGEIRLGGVPIREAKVAELRWRLGFVTGDVQRFEGAVRDNLTFFDRTIPDWQLLAVLEDLGLGSWYRRLPHGLDTMLEPGGGGLSAGEAQLLAFARIFLCDPGLVIMDEASSRLDPATEALVERAVTRLLESRTGIIIAHRLATVQRADQILILEDGRIPERGERERLAADPATRFSRLLRTGLEEVLVG